MKSVPPLSEAGSDVELDPGRTPNPWGVKAEAVTSDEEMAGCEPPLSWGDQFEEEDVGFASEEGCPVDACSDISGALLGPNTPSTGGPEAEPGETGGEPDGSEEEWEPSERVEGDWERASR